MQNPMILVKSKSWTFDDISRFLYIEIQKDFN